MKFVTILRHGEAAQASIDRSRQLTAMGRLDIANASTKLFATCVAKDIPEPDTLLYSAWERTAQTAELIAATHNTLEMAAQTALQPGHGAHVAAARLAEFAAARPAMRHVLVVSHQPLVSALADYYLGSCGTVPALCPGGLVTLSMELFAQGCANLRFWSLPPEYRVAS